MKHVVNPIDSIVSRDSITGEEMRMVLDTETHHDHVIICDSNGTYRWKENDTVRKIIDRTNLNDIIVLLHCLGHDKNSETYRKMYRDMGYSLYGYWEIFYWEANNDAADEYKPQAHK